MGAEVTVNRLLRERLESMTFLYKEQVPCEANTTSKSDMSPTSNTTSWLLSSFTQLTFPDEFKDIQTSLKPATYPFSTTLAETPSLVINTIADGVIMDFNTVEMEMVPFTRSYFLEYEAGIKDMVRWLGETTEAIKARRERFAWFLQTRFNMTHIPLELPAEALWVENEVRGIKPYSGSHNSDYRISSIMKGRGPFQLEGITQFIGQRVIEVGFKYEDPKVGLIKQGVYIISDYRGNKGVKLLSGVPVDILKFDFETIIPSKVDELDNAII